MSTAENQSAPGAASTAEPSTYGMPSETTRTILTLVLIVHFFIAFVAAIGEMRANSVIFSRLGSKFDAQLQYPSYFLLSRFAYQLTYNRDIDYDGSAEIVLNWEAADEANPDRIAAKEKLVLFEPDEIELPIRRQRYLSMIRRMTDVAASQPPSPREIDMPMAVSALLLTDAGNPDGNHRFRLLRIPTPAPSYADEAQTPTMPPAYRGNITMRDGKFEFTKADRAALVSPPVSGRRNPSSSNDLGLPSGGELRLPPADGLPGDSSFDPRSPQPLDDRGRTDGNR